MSELSYMEKVLDGVEVEWRALEEVVKIQRGKRLIRSQLEKSGNYAVYQNSMKPLGYYHESNVKPDTTFIISAGAAGEIGYSDVGFWAADDVYYLLTPDNVESKFLYYYLLLQQYKILAQVRRASIPRLSRTAIEKIQIPIPLLNIQTEIVRILDAFTELTAELTAELVARKQQYAYYRDQLLTFNDDEVEWKALGEITMINTGQKPSDVLDVATPYDYINAGTSRSGYSISNNCEGDTVTTPSRGQGGIGYVGYQRQPFWLGALCYKMKSINENFLMNKYLFYFFQSRSQLLLALKKEGGVPAVNKSDLAKLEIPVPPLAEQQRIVAILDKFDALTTSLTEGLPREIALRQQQYEYYRELLLSFPKAEVAIHD